MTSPFYQFDPQLTLHDFMLLHRPFSREIARLFPVATSPFFWSSAWDTLPGDAGGMTADDFRGKVARACAADRAGLIGDMLVIPLPVEDGAKTAVVLKDIDPALSAKMAPEWLQEIKQDILVQLHEVKKGYVHRETGLYTSRLLRETVQDEATGPGWLFFVGAMHRPGSPTNGMVNIVQTARLLEVSVQEPVYYLGGNLYALLQGSMARDAALDSARRLLVRLKREGLHRVHIGIKAREEGIPAGKGEALLNGCWQALETAEKRGPFSLCESSFLDAADNNPLAKPPAKIIRRLQKQWRGLERFGLLLFRLDYPGTGGSAPDLGGLLQEHVAAKYSVIALSPSEACVLLPGLTAKQSGRVGQQLKAKVDRLLQPVPVALGTAYWPCLHYAKSETVVNCRRALMHGAFFGPGKAIVFDHVSLNVSGDYCFDEGDYRQAVKDYQAGLRLQPDDINLMNSIGVALGELNRHRQALQCFDAVLARDPKDFMAQVNRGFTLRMLGRHDEALACFERVARNRKFAASPVFADISLQLGRLYCAAGQFGKARIILEKLAKIHSDRQGFYLYRSLGEAYARTGKNSQAIATLQKAVRLNPQDARSLSILGQLYASEGQGNDIALALCAQALALDDTPWQYWYRLAWVRSHTGDHEGALAAVMESLRRNRRDVDSLLLAGKLYRQLGSQARAKSMYQRVLKLEPEQRQAGRAMKYL